MGNIETDKKETDKKENVLVSACLLGLCCRYDGKEKKYDGMEEMKELCHLVPVCPEQLGGLKTPREPAEIHDGRVFTCSGDDVTAGYDKGAEEALKAAKFFECRYALLKERSPSCGCGQVYDGAFAGRLTPGNGITAELLLKNGIEVMGESSISRLKEKLRKD